MKCCKTCLKNKELSEYHKDKRQSDGFRYTCKQCIKEYQLKWRGTKREELLIKSQNYYENNKDHKKSYDKDYRLSNSEKIKNRLRDNKDSINIRANKYSKLRRIKDINFRISHSIRTRISSITKNKKPSSAIKEIGCSVDDLKLHLESKFQIGMTWDNYGKWHIDHIKPLSKFNLLNLEEFKEACHYSNLQPLWAFDNIRKSNKF